MPNKTKPPYGQRLKMRTKPTNPADAVPVLVHLSKQELTALSGLALHIEIKTEGVYLEKYDGLVLSAITAIESQTDNNLNSTASKYDRAQALKASIKLALADVGALQNITVAELLKRLDL